MTSTRVSNDTGWLTHIEIVFVWIIEHFDQLDDVRMIEFLEYRDFTINALEWMVNSRLAAITSRQLLCAKATVNADFTLRFPR